MSRREGKVIHWHIVIHIVRLGLNVALTHQIVSYRDCMLPYREEEYICALSCKEKTYIAVMQGKEKY